MDISTFKKKSSEINEKMETIQQDLYQNMDFIQRNYQVINNALNNTHEKENEAYIARSKLQEFIVWRQKLNVPWIPLFHSLSR